MNFVAGTAAPGPTGLSIAEHGIVTFVPGQTFPGVVTGVSAGAGITVTGTATNPIVSVSSSGITSAMIATETITSADIANGQVGLVDLAFDPATQAAVNIASGGVTSAMIATSAVTSAAILNSQVGTTDLAFDPATQTELNVHEHDSRYFTETASADRFHPVYTQLLYSARHVGDAPGGDWNPFRFLEVGTFTKQRSDSQIRLIWNGSVRVDKNDVRFYNNDHCGYQLRIDFDPAVNDAGQGWSYVEDQSVQ